MLPNVNFLGLTIKSDVDNFNKFTILDPFLEDFTFNELQLLLFILLTNFITFFGLRRSTNK